MTPGDRRDPIAPGVAAREDARPYYHYQSLFHDPRGAAEGVAVAPSPLSG